MASNANWTVPSSLCGALSALIHRRVQEAQARADNLRDVEEQLLPQDQENANNRPLEVRVNLETGGELFNVVCGLCVELDVENALQEKKIAVLVTQLARRNKTTIDASNQNTSSSPMHPDVDIDNSGIIPGQDSSVMHVTDNQNENANAADPDDASSNMDLEDEVTKSLLIPCFHPPRRMINVPDNSHHLSHDKPFKMDDPTQGAQLTWRWKIAYTGLTAEMSTP
ncbi:hypothetical protein FRB99_008410 [Tulasnella sp. 403]|nr:hypothetical protein FRB99_008410 [Tulasnella sp. 403]